MPLLGPTPEEIKAAEEAKAAKAAKAAARAEAEQKAKEAKEAAEEAARIAKEQAAAAAVVAASAADEAYGSGKKGEALATHVSGMATKPTAAALAAVVLSKLEDGTSLKWCSLAEYGAALKAAAADDAKGQAALLHAVQKHLNGLQPTKFPKTEIKGKPKAVVEAIFQLLYANEIVDPAGFYEWADDDDDTNGKVTAVVQTTSFFQFLREADEDGGDEEEEEDEEIDAPRPTV
jgi:hypothetical protein